MTHAHDHCIEGFDPHPTDGTLPDRFAEYTENGQTDATLRPEIIAWMDSQAWQESHFLWHQVRRCTSGGGFGGGFGGFGGGGNGAVDPCHFTEMRPAQNECAGPQDGYEFLVMHRHMIHTLKQLWPSMKDQFAGWDKFPGQSDYPSVVQQYFRPWGSGVAQDAALADGIDRMTREEVLARWPTEGHFGQWIQCGTLQGGLGLNGLHGALHFNAFPPNNQAHSVANQRRNLDAYTFWKLHGWIDMVWDKYRAKVGLPSEDPQLEAELIKQCQEHHFWAQQIDPSLAQPDPQQPTDESGYFHEMVRPALEEGGCTGCHGPGESAGLRLGYNVSSTEIVQRLVNVNSAHAQGYKLVVPGNPDSSWLYLKASGASQNSNAVCNQAAQSTCKQPMPGMTQAGLNALRQWILDGAPAPTKP